MQVLCGRAGRAVIGGICFGCGAVSSRLVQALGVRPVSYTHLIFTTPVPLVMSACSSQTLGISLFSRGSTTWQPVSYTHLDVYKRQSGSRSSPPNTNGPPRPTPSLWRWCRTLSCRISGCRRDVYKRQAFSCIFWLGTMFLLAWLLLRREDVRA